MVFLHFILQTFAEELAPARVDILQRNIASRIIPDIFGEKNLLLYQFKS